MCGPDGACFADNHVLTKLRECYLFLPMPMHACPHHGPWVTSLTDKTCRGGKRGPDALVGDGQLRETSPTEKSVFQNCWGLGVGLTIRPQVKNIVTKSMEGKAGPICQGRQCKGLKDLRDGSRNVLPLYQSGALKMILSQLDSYKMGITDTQEIRWTSEGTIDKKYHTIFYTYDRKQHVWNRLHSK